MENEVNTYTFPQGKSDEQAVLTKREFFKLRKNVVFRMLLNVAVSVLLVLALVKLVILICCAFSLSDESNDSLTQLMSGASISVIGFDIILTVILALCIRAFRFTACGVILIIYNALVALLITLGLMIYGSVFVGFSLLWGGWGKIGIPFLIPVVLFVMYFCLTFLMAIVSVVCTYNLNSRWKAYIHTAQNSVSKEI